MSRDDRPLHAFFNIALFLAIQVWFFLPDDSVCGAVDTIVGVFIGNIRRFRRSYYPKRQIGTPLRGAGTPAGCFATDWIVTAAAECTQPTQARTNSLCGGRNISRKFSGKPRDATRNHGIYYIQFFEEFRAKLISNYKIELCRNFKFVRNKKFEFALKSSNSRNSCLLFLPKIVSRPENWIQNFWFN